MGSFEKCGLTSISKLGGGTYSEVFAVKDDKGDLHALKLDKGQSAYQTYYGITTLNEIDVLARIRHPNLMYTTRIITTKDCDIGGLGLLLPLGMTTMHDQLDNKLYTTEQKIKNLFETIDGVNWLHENSILHLDLKPGNIIITAYPDGKAIVSDFGLAAYIDQPDGFVASNRESITLTFRPPELIQDPPWVYRPSADIWSIGIIALHLFSGRKNIYEANMKWDEVKKKYLNMFDTNREATFTNLLKNVEVKYRDLVLDFVNQTLAIKADKRPSAAKLLKLPLFQGLTGTQGGLTMIPNLPPKTDPITREVMKYISVICQKAYPDRSIEMLFLAYDIGYRAIGPFLELKLGSLILASVAVWMAAKIIHNAYTQPSNIVSKACTSLFGDACIVAKIYYDYEVVIVHELQGCLYRHYLYHAAIDKNQLTQTYQYIVLDPSAYYTVDISKWYAINKHVQGAALKEFTKISSFFK